jgi:transposase
VRARTEKQRAYEHRRRQERTRKQQRAAKLLAQRMKQQAVAAELGVTTRTLRNWKAAPAFQRERERQHKQTARQRTGPPHSKLKPRARRGAGDARRDRPRRSRPTAELTPASDVEQAERERPALAAEEQANGADRPRAPAPSQHQGVPIFPNTPDGHAARLAYFEARKLNNPPNSLLDYHDAKHGLEPPAEGRARKQRDNPPPR